MAFDEETLPRFVLVVGVRGEAARSRWRNAWRERAVPDRAGVLPAAERDLGALIEAEPRSGRGAQREELPAMLKRVLPR
jgi:hypothetical protein